MLDSKAKLFAADKSGEESRLIVGLDIGTTKVCAIVGQLDEEGKIRILGISKVNASGVRKGRISNVTQTVGAIKQAVEKASDIADVDIDEVVVGIAGSHIKMTFHEQNVVRQDRVEPITEEEILKMENQIRNMRTPGGTVVIHVLPQEYVIDGELISGSPVGEVGQSIGGRYMMISGNELEVPRKCLNESNLRVEGYVIEPLASAQAVLTQEEMDEGIVLVDMGGGTTDIVIFKDGKVRYTDMIPLGGNIITEDIRSVLNISRTQAEELKTQFGSAITLEDHRNVRIALQSPHGREPRELMQFDLNQVIKARVEELFESVNRSIKSSPYAKEIPYGMVMTGGCAKMPFIKVIAQLKTGFDARLGLPNISLSAENQKINDPSLATTIGLVSYGLKNNIESQVFSDDDKTSKRSGRISGFFKDLFKQDRDIDKSIDFRNGNN